MSASEFFVALSASISFIIFLGWSQINLGLVVSLSIGGLIAAPFAAWLVKNFTGEYLSGLRKWFDYLY